MITFENIFNDSEHRTGDYVLMKLKSFTQDKPVYFAVIPEGYHNEEYYPVNSFFSWRGSYDCPSIWSEGNTVYTAKELIDQLNDFFGSVQHGYKGGGFIMFSDDRLWCDAKGSFTERGVKDVVETEDKIFIVVDEFKY